MTDGKTSRRFDYTWVIVALCFMMIFVCLGLCSSNKSLFLAPITEALQIHRSLFSLSDSIRYISTAVVNIFFGALTARFGNKKMIAAGFISLIICMLCYSFAENVIGFYVGSMFLGMGLAWTTTTMVGSVINKWCRAHKGTIMGAALAANGIGGALATQIVSPIIYRDTFGYRNAYRLVVVILAVTFIVVMLLFRENPPEDSALRKASGKEKKRGSTWSGISFDEARRMPFFYILAVCIFMTGLVIQSVSTVAAAHMRDVGLDPAYVTTVVSVHALALAAFKFLTGFMYDHMGLRFTASVCSGAAVVCMLLLASLSNTDTGRTVAMVYGILSSLALPLETIMLPLFAGDLFGQKSYNKILGIVVSVNTAGYAVGAPLINGGFDLLGSYRPMFFLCAGLMVGVLILLQFTLNAAYREKKRILAQE